MAPAPARVSVVVPTYHRPALVVTAVRSALAQEPEPLEVVVVVDGRDEETVSALRALGDEGVRVVVPDERLGNAEARNEGVRRADGEWIALLDDDDEWLPGKLAAQLETARASPHRCPVVSCRLLVRTEGAEFVWPSRLPAPDEPLGDYLFLRRSPFTGEAMVQTSTVLAPRALLRAVPFRRGLARHVDPDWVLRAAAQPGVGIEFARPEEPLAVWNIEERRRRVTGGEDDWRASLAWIESVAPFVSPRARASFVMTQVSATAAREREWRAFAAVPRAALRHARPSPVDVAVHAANFLVPRALQRGLAARFGIGAHR